MLKPMGCNMVTGMKMKLFVSGTDIRTIFGYGRKLIYRFSPIVIRNALANRETSVDLLKGGDLSDPMVHCQR
jgi:hypothetical protein